MTERKCGDCSLCCKLVPVRELEKGAGERCKYQRHTGCTVYNTVKMPISCGLWSCRWLVNDDTADLSRPDRSHYVIDIMPDFVMAVEEETGAERRIDVVQVWVDPRYPDAHRDPALRAYLERRGQFEGLAAIIRYSANDGFVLFSPAISGDRQWHEQTGKLDPREHTALEVFGVHANADRP